MNIGEIAQIYNPYISYVNIRGHIFQVKRLENNSNFFNAVEKHCDIMIRSDGRVIKNRCGAVLEEQYFHNFTYRLRQANKHFLPELEGTNEEDVLNIIRNIENNYAAFSYYNECLLKENNL